MSTLRYDPSQHPGPSASRCVTWCTTPLTNRWSHSDRAMSARRCVHFTVPRCASWQIPDGRAASLAG